MAAALFGAFTIWKNRPWLGPPRVGRAGRQAFADARARVVAATTPAERALALCDAGDARAALVGNVTSALGYYLRAMRSDPTSAAPILRAARGLARRPRALESLLWRRLGTSAWDGEHRAATLAALTELERVYARSLRNRSRARAIRHALAALGQPPAGSDSPRAAPPDRG